MTEHPDVDRVGLLTGAAAHRWSAREAARLGDRALTFADLHRWSETLAADLVLGGVRAGDRVMIMLPNSLEVPAAVTAAWRIGAVAVPVVPIYRGHEIAQIVVDARPSCVVTIERLGERALRAEVDTCLRDAGIDPPLRYVVGGETPAPCWRTFPAPDADPAPTVLPDPAPSEVECLRLYTSGTTSAPKGARLASPALITGAWKFHTDLGLDHSDVGLALAPVTHIAGLLAACLVPLTCGAGAVLLPRWNARDAVEAIDRHRATWSLGAAVFLNDMVEEYETRADDLHKLTYFVSGGASTAPTLIERADRLGIRAMRTYGMTETAGPATLAGPEARLVQRAHLDGPVVGGLDVQVVDDDRQPVPAGTEGHIRIRGEQVMLGYSDPDATRAAMPDGWFYPGDIGLIDDDRWMRITGRTKDIINRGGEKLSAADIEAAIQRHPDVAATAVIGVPHERLGEVVCAFVVARTGVTALDPDAIRDFLLAADLAKVKLPQEWHVVDALPTTASGKVQKHLLRERCRTPRHNSAFQPDHM